MSFVFKSRKLMLLKIMQLCMSGQSTMSSKEYSWGSRQAIPSNRLNEFPWFEIIRRSVGKQVSQGKITKSSSSSYSHTSGHHEFPRQVPFDCQTLPNPAPHQFPLFIRSSFFSQSSRFKRMNILYSFRLCKDKDGGAWLAAFGRLRAPDF